MPSKSDTIKIVLKSNAVLIKNGDSAFEIRSLLNVPSNIKGFHISANSTNRYYGSLFFAAGLKNYQIEISAFTKYWSWDITAESIDQRFGILYNGYKKNRLSTIFVQDDTLRHGMSLSTTFRSLRKIDRLESAYTDRMTINGKQTITNIPLEKYYNYRYDRKGKLILGSMVGELKRCDCRGTNGGMLSKK